MSTVAAFIALGGASYAAVTLPRASVGTPQLKAGAVTPDKLARPVIAATSNSTGELFGISCPAVPEGSASTCTNPVPKRLGSVSVRLKQPGHVLLLVSAGFTSRAFPNSEGRKISDPASIAVFRRGDDGSQLGTRAISVPLHRGETLTNHSVLPAEKGKQTYEIFASSSAANVVLDYDVSLTAVTLP